MFLGEPGLSKQQLGQFGLLQTSCGGLAGASDEAGFDRSRNALGETRLRRRRAASAELLRGPEGTTPRRRRLIARGRRAALEIFEHFLLEVAAIVVLNFGVRDLRHDV